MKTTPNLEVVAHDHNGNTSTWKISDSKGNLWINRLRKCLKESTSIEMPSYPDESGRIEIPAALLDNLLIQGKRNSRRLKNRNRALDDNNELIQQIRSVVEARETETQCLIADILDGEQNTTTVHRETVNDEGRI